MEISVFKSDKNPNALRKEMTWDQLCASLRKPYPATTPKNKLPMWSPAVFRENRRAAANVEVVSCLVFDVDETPVPTLEEIARAVGDFRWFAHSSSSSTIEVPRWRLIVPLSQPVTRADYTKLWRKYVERLPFPVGKSSKDSSRAWYAPRVCKDASFVVSP